MLSLWFLTLAVNVALVSHTGRELQRYQKGLYQVVKCVTNIQDGRARFHGEEKTKKVVSEEEEEDGKVVGRKRKKRRQRH